jgi:uncharacterized protein (TIGR02099 family)
MVKKSLLWIYRTALWLLGIIVAIFVIAILAIQFYVFPNIDQYKDKIAAFASNAAKQKVVIGNIKAGWQGINPHLVVSNIDIYDAQNRPALQLNNTDVSVSWLSIPLLEPHLANFTIRSPELTIRRNANGDIYVAGISMQGESKPDLPNWLLRQTKLNVLNARVVWIDEMRGAPTLSLDNLNLQVYSPPWKSLIKNHRITLSALPSVGTFNPILINANVYGNDVSRIAQWHGSLEAKLKNANLAAFKPWFDYSAFTHPFDLQSGIGSTDTKIQFAKSQVQSVISSVALSNVQLKLKANTEPLVLNKLVGELDWKNTATEQSFKVNRLTLNTSNGLSLQDASGAYAQTKQGNQKLNFKLTHIDLAFIKPYLVQLPLPAEVVQKITNLSPTGKLDDASLTWEGKQSATTKYQLNSKFNNLSILAYEKIPGFNNLTGEIKANQHAGKITLHSQKAELDFKDVLRWPIPADTLEGDISWNTNDTPILSKGTQGKHTEIKVSGLSISSPHLTGTINADYLMDGNKGGLLDLKGKFGKGNAKFAAFYYPNILDKTTLQWLDTSILAGRAEDINLIVKGRLDDFPFADSKNNLDPKLGLFRVTAKISNALLEFGTGWPVIEGLGLDLLFEGKRMELNANAGHILGNQIIKSKTTIAQLDADSPILNIDSELTGPVAEGIKFVNNSPVVNVTLGFTEDLKTSGQGKLNLGLKIPLHDVDASLYKGLYQITNGSMNSPSIPTLTNINGSLEFTESSLTAKNINARAFGSPVTLNLSTGKDKVIRVTAKGTLNDEAIKQALLDQDPTNRTWVKGSNYISGNTDWVSDITIQKPVVNIGIRADLFGITSRLPVPFNKAANERLNLRIDKKQDASTDTITISLGNKLAAKLIRNIENGKLNLDRGSVRLNSSAASNAAANSSELNANLELSNAKGLQIYGNLDYLDADAWRNVLRDFTGVSEQGSSLPIQKIALKINMLDIFDRRINQLNISNNANKDGLRAIVQSREISGDLQWQNQNNGKLIARLSNLIVPEATPTRLKIAPSDTSVKVFNKLEQDYPSLDITADNFEFNKKNFGALELIAYPQNDNWNIQKLKLTTPDSVISAEGLWNNWVRSPNTFLNVAWDIKNLGKTLKSLGYPDTIKGGEGSLKGQLHWPGSPHEFNPVGLNGEFQLNVNKGQILKVQPGVGRLLGLLSLQSLPRRLTLDFRDLFSNGFAFDKIDATVKIDKGVMYSDNFTMSGPAADVTIRGEANLQKETQHLMVKVMPRISDSVSLAALAGGPLVGAIAFLAQKILKDPLNKIASSEYEIIGTWDNPQEVGATKTNQEPMTNNSPLN